MIAASIFPQQHHETNSLGRNRSIAARGWAILLEMAQTELRGGDSFSQAHSNRITRAFRRVGATGSFGNISRQ
jgi:hypothetical protein